MTDFEREYQPLKPNVVDETTQYGTVNSIDGDTSQSTVNNWLSVETQYQRWKETALSLPQFMLSAAGYEIFNLMWWGPDDENSIVYYYWMGLGAFIGAFVGHMIILPFIVGKYDVFRELEEASIISLSIIFGPSTTLPWIKYVCAEHGISFTEAFFFIWFTAFISYFGMPFLFRALFQCIKIGKTRWLQSNMETVYDLYNSSSVGFGYAFMYGNYDVSGNWLSIFEITSETSSIVDIFLVVSAFTVGYLIWQTLQNLLLPATWTDENQIITST